MSGIKFATEGENLGLGSRPRPKKRRSSILKSPSRNALQDLDPNAGEERDTAGLAKKKRRSSRRVSFANTYQVQEFFTANQLEILEDNNAERDTTQPVSPEKDAEPSSYNTPSAVIASQDGSSIPTVQPDISVGPGHCIRGLETLLSGPIKNPAGSHGQAIISDPEITHTYPQPRQGTTQLPKIDESCENQVERRVESSATERWEPNSHETQGLQDWPTLAGNLETFSVGLAGPSYHCMLPVPDSFSSSCHTSFGSSFASLENPNDIGDPDVNLDNTANFELTMYREKYLAGWTDSEDVGVIELSGDQVVKKKDASSFLKSFMEGDPADGIGQAARSTFQTYTNENCPENQAPRKDSRDFLKSFVESNSKQPPLQDPVRGANSASDGFPKKRDAKSFLQSLFGSVHPQPSATSPPEETRIFTQDDAASEMDLTGCVNAAAAEEGCKKKDAFASLKPLAETDAGDVLGRPVDSTCLSKVEKEHIDDQKTHIFGQKDEVTSGMDFTTCMSGMLQTRQTPAISSKHPDTTVRFGDDNEGNMEFTQCIGSVQEQHQQQRPSAQKQGRAGRPLEDITRIFDGQTDGMDLTTCGNHLSAYSFDHPQSDAEGGQTRIFHHSDNTAAMELTTCLGIQASFMKSEQKGSGSNSSKNSQLDVEPEKTKTFRQDDTTAAMEMTTCLADHGNFVQLNKNISDPNSSNKPQPRAAVEDTRLFHLNDTAAVMEMTACLNGNPSFAKTGTSSSDSDHSHNLQVTVGPEMTRIFHCDDNTAAMEMTTCLDGKTSLVKTGTNVADPDSPSSLQPSAATQATRIFQYDDATAAMDMTECLDENLGTSTSGGDIAHPENTDECVDELSPKAKMKPESRRVDQLTSGALKQLQASERTELDSTQIFKSEDANGMDLTTCTGGVLWQQSQSQGNLPEKMLTVDAKQQNTLQTMDEGAELPESGSGIVRRSSRTFLTVQREEVTRHFTSDDTARMEMTACIGGVSLSASNITHSQQLSAKQDDKTQIFSADDRAQMELTTCVGSLKPLPLMVPPSSKKSQRLSHLDETNKMEMTACVGGIFPQMLAGSSQSEPTKLLRDHTKVFTSDDTASMDVTKCVGSLHSQPFTPSTQPDAISDHTRMFTSDDTARMEMTSCTGGLLPQTSSKTSTNIPDSTQTTGIDGLPELKTKSPTRETSSVTSTTGRLHCPQDQTRIFTTDNTASMEITTCVGGINPNSKAESSNDGSTGSISDEVGLSQPSGGRSLDQTRIFTHENTGRMEFTTCIGGIKDGDLKRSSQKNSPNDSDVKRSYGPNTSVSPPLDSTRFFTHEEASQMELTKCRGIEDKTMDLSSKCIESQVLLSPGRLLNSQAVEILPSGQTHLSAHNDTGQMELTRCAGGISNQQLQHRKEMDGMGGREGETSGDEVMVFTSDETSSLDSRAGQSSQITSLTEQTKEGRPDQTRVLTSDDTAAVEVNKCDDTSKLLCQSSEQLPLANSNKSITQDTYPTKRDSDTFTIDPSPISGATEPTTRRSETYTLDELPAAASAMGEDPTADTNKPEDKSGYPTAATNNQGSSGDEGIAVLGDLNRWGSLDSTDGIENEQPVWVENTEDFAQLSAEAAVASMMMVQAMKEQTDSKNVYDLPTFARGQAQGVTAASLMPNVDGKEHVVATEVAEGLVSSSDSNLCADVKPSQTTASAGPVSMQDFLDFVTLNIVKGRRSILPCIPQVVTPPTLSDFMEEHFITKPKKELYEWAISHLSTSIEKMQTAVNEQEQRMSENNPEIVTEVLHASPEQAAVLRDHIERLHKACTKMSRGSFQDWRLKMVSKTHKSLKETEEEVNGILATLTSSLDAVNASLEEVGKFKEGLDETLTRLKSFELPSEEQVKEFIECRNQLANRQLEVEEMQNNKAALESESTNLKMEIQQFEKELADTRQEEMLLNSQTTSQDDLEEAMIKLDALHCLQAWRLRSHSEKELVFTFLEDSLILTITLGKELGAADGNIATVKEIADLRMESFLADDASVSARLAHNLVQASIGVDVLRSQHPTTSTLKMLLLEVSEAVSRADGIASETDRISYRHVVTLNGTNLTVEFSSLDAMVKFWVTLNLLPGSYPFSTITADFRHKIGQLKEQDVQAALGQVKPGWTYFSRLVGSIDAMIQQHIPNDPVF